MPLWVWLMFGSLLLLTVAFVVTLYAIGAAAHIDHKWDEPKKKEWWE